MDAANRKISSHRTTPHPMLRRSSSSFSSRVQEESLANLLSNYEFDPEASLQDLYDFAIRRIKGKLTELLLQILTVAEDKFPV